MPGVCYQYQKGECTRGDSCRFSHDGKGEAGNYSAAPRRGGGNVCYAFQKGKPSWCALIKNRAVIKYHHIVGECDRGDSCRFSHEGGDSSGYNAGGYSSTRRSAPCTTSHFTKSTERSRMLTNDAPPLFISMSTPPVRSVDRAQFCGSSKEDLRVDGLKSTDDCPACKEQGILCTAANHPSTASAGKRSPDMIILSSSF